jgi:hypothetical protein
MISDDELRQIVANLAISQAKTDAQLAKTDAQLAKTDTAIDELIRSQAKTDAQLAKTDAKLDRLAEMYGGVGNNQGKVAEEFYYNSLGENPVLNGIAFDFIEKNITRKKGKIEEEYDILLVNGCDVFIIEVKYHLHPKDIARLMGRKQDNFRKLFPEYANYTLHLALATFAVEDDVKAMALEQGVTVLQRKGNVIETIAA